MRSNFLAGPLQIEMGGWCWLPAECTVFVHLLPGGQQIVCAPLDFPLLYAQPHHDSSRHPDAFLRGTEETRVDSRVLSAIHFMRMCGLQRAKNV